MRSSVVLVGLVLTSCGDSRGGPADAPLQNSCRVTPRCTHYQLQPAQALAVPRVLAHGDVDGNGCEDFVAMSNAGPTAVLGHCDRTFTGGGASSQPLAPLALGDVTGDGKVDVISAQEGSAAAILLYAGNGDGTFQPAATLAALPSYTAVDHIEAVDVDHDGTIEVVAAEQRINTRGQLEVISRSRPRASYDLPQPAFAMAVGDVDADGFADVLGGCQSYSVGADPIGGGASLLAGVSGGGLDGSGSVAIAMAPTQLALADFDGDCRLDLVGVIGDPMTNAVVALGAGDRTFGSPTAVMPADRIAVGDIDGDGRADLMALRAGTLTLWQAAGSGAVDMLQQVPGFPVVVRGFFIADLDHDGVPDVLASDGSGDTTTVAYGACQ